MIKPGKKTLAWNKAREELKKEFQAMGITTCEIKFDGCWRDNALSFAHTRKRRNVIDLKRVVLACIPCHDIVEKWGEAKMEIFLEDIISNRRIKK